MGEVSNPFHNKQIYEWQMWINNECFKFKIKD